MPALIGLVLIAVAVGYVIEFVQQHAAELLILFAALAAIAIAVALFVFQERRKTSRTVGSRLSSTAGSLQPDATVRHQVARDKLLLRYQDADSGITERVISPHYAEITSAGQNPLIVAHCSLRDDIRSFRLDRVIWLADAGTGEVIPDPMTYFGLQPKHQATAGLPVVAPTRRPNWRTAPPHEGEPRWRLMLVTPEGTIERVVRPRRAFHSKSGVLEGVVSLGVWCETGHTSASVVVATIAEVWDEAVGARIGDVRSAIRDGVAKGRLTTGREPVDGPGFPQPTRGDMPTPVVSPFDIILVQAVDFETRVSVTGAFVAPCGLIYGLRGRNSATRRVGNHALSVVRSIVDPNRGENIQGDVQAWLQDRIANASARARSGQVYVGASDALTAPKLLDGGRAKGAQ